ncbi:thioredoxin [Candidatus Mesenet endosymbiont of Agriotes lineatus]|uniref:thioredoxin n=1 Tax=Candidatus Mesenet endosymbiont of Agriotes lineatus TaxID=3077948 RepID=UPI0030CEEFD9
MSIVEIKDDNHFNEVIKNNDFVLVDFWAEWCGPCKALMPHIEKLAESHKEKITVCKLNIDKVQEAASSYNVMSIPTLIILNNGKELARKIGGCDFETLVKWVNSEIED